MSYYEALEDGVPIAKDNRGFHIYYPPCSYCGCGVKSWNYIRGNKYICPECKALLFIEKKETKISNSQDKRLRQLNAAISRISKHANIKNYENGIEQMKKSMNDEVWFQSTEEIMVALQLIKKGIKFVPQYKVGLFTCDFYLPDLKAILEVDGDLFHMNKKDHDKERDECIRSAFNDEVEVIRIKTSLLNVNVTKVTNAIYAVLKYRKKMRTNDSL